MAKNEKKIKNISACQNSSKQLEIDKVSVK